MRRKTNLFSANLRRIFVHVQNGPIYVAVLKIPPHATSVTWFKKVCSRIVAKVGVVLIMFWLLCNRQLSKAASVFYPKLIKQEFEWILSRETGIRQIAFDAGPVMQSVVIEHLQIVGNNEWYNSPAQAFAEHNQAPHSSVAILKWMYRLKAMVEIKNVVKRHCILGIIRF